MVNDGNPGTGAWTSPPTTLADYLAILRRRKWIIIILPIVTAAATYALSASRSPIYEASAQLLVSRAGIVTAVADIQDPATFDATRYLTTQSTIARSPELAERVVDAAGVRGVSAGDLLSMSDVSPRPDADLLDISVSHSDAGDAVDLANAYARQFVRYRTELDTARINDALRVIRSQMAQLQARGRTDSDAYETLTQYRGQLETIGKLQANNTSVLRLAEGAGQISPRPRQDAVLGGLLGLILGLGVAFLLEALDRRVRSSHEIEGILGLPLLGRVPPPPRKLGNTNTPVMLSEPVSPPAEAFRKVRTTIEMENLGRGRRTLMFTSAIQREGKSTTIANLAIAFARLGRRVAVVDLDLRRPSLHMFFGAHTRHGIIDVIDKHHDIERVIQRVTLPPVNPVSLELETASPAVASHVRWGSPGSVHARSRGRRDESNDTIHFLAAGAVPADGEFLKSERVAAVLQELGEAFDVVLVDAPPLLAVGDAMSLTASVDAVVVVTRIETKRPVLRELARELRHCKAPCLGFVLTGVPEDHGYDHEYGYGYGYQYGYRADPERVRALTPELHDGMRPSDGPAGRERGGEALPRHRPS
jgi:polysaccharide biosynthesis transport protein